MDWLLPFRECVQTIEDGVDVARVVAEVEDRVERNGVEAFRDLGVGPNELGEVELLLPRAHRVALDEAVRLVSRETGVHQREQQPLAEVQAAAELEVAPHLLRMDHETLDE